MAAVGTLEAHKDGLTAGPLPPLDGDDCAGYTAVRDYLDGAVAVGRRGRCSSG